MHEYYQHSSRKLRKKMNSYLCMIKPEVEAIFKKPYSQVFEEIWQYYETVMLDVLPYIGGDSVSGTKNLTGCAFFIAFGEVGKNYGLSTHDWGYLSTILYQRYFERIPSSIRMIMGHLMQKHPELVRKALERKDRKNADNAAKNPGSFVTQTIAGTTEYPIIYHTLTCPVYEFCRLHGYMEYLPYLCNLDYVMFGSLGMALHREKQCSQL